MVGGKDDRTRWRSGLSRSVDINRHCLGWCAVVGCGGMDIRSLVMETRGQDGGPVAAFMRLDFIAPGNKGRPAFKLQMTE
jgi:hypothetical protein